MLLQYTTHLIQRPCYQRGSPCQDPVGKRNTRRPPDHRKETQTAVVWSCLPFIRSGQNYLAKHIEIGKKTEQTEQEVGRQHQGMDKPGVRQVLKGSGEQGKWRKLVAKSSVVPKRLSRSRERWWWEREIWRSRVICFQVADKNIIGKKKKILSTWLWCKMKFDCAKDCRNRSQFS